MAGPYNAGEAAGRNVLVTPDGNDVSSSNPLPVTMGGSGSTSSNVQGAQPSNSAPTTNPVLEGAVARVTPVAVTDGTINALTTDGFAGLYVTLKGPASASPNSFSSSSSDGVINAVPTYRFTARGEYFDGTTWNRARGDTNGAYVITKGGSSIVTGQVAVTTSSTLVAAARTGRQSITITSTSAVVFYVGATGVTTATGLYVAAAAGATVTLNTAAAVYAIGASAVTLSYLETF